MSNITAWGDSLTFGTGSSDPTTAAWPARLTAALPGQAVNNLGVSGETSAQILARVQADAAHRSDVQVFWMGHNNADYAGVAADIASCVAAIAPNTNYLVLSTISRTYEPLGSTGSNEVIALNASLAAAYGSRFIDVLSMLVDAYDPTIPAEVSERAQGLIPDSLRDGIDTIHLSDAGYALVARMVSQAIFAQAWATTPRVLTEVIPTPTRSLNEILAVYRENGVPRNVPLVAAATLRASYVTAGHAAGAKALLDFQADAAARVIVGG